MTLGNDDDTFGVAIYKLRSDSDDVDVDDGDADEGVEGDCYETSFQTDDDDYDEHVAAGG